MKGSWLVALSLLAIQASLAQQSCRDLLKDFCTWSASCSAESQNSYTYESTQTSFSNYHAICYGNFTGDTGDVQGRYLDTWSPFSSQTLELQLEKI